MNNFPHLIEVALLLLVAYLIGCVIGYLIRVVLFPPQAEAETEAPAVAPIEAPASSVTTSSSPAPAEKPRTSKRGGASEPTRPTTLEQPNNGKKDNLKMIKGIGPRIEANLNELGIFHFEQIAQWDEATIKWVDAHLSFKGRINREKWVPQAKALVAEAKSA